MKPDIQAFLEAFRNRSANLVGTVDVLNEKRRFVEGTKSTALELRARGVSDGEIAKTIREAAADQDYDIADKLIREVFSTWDAKPRKAAKLPSPRVAKRPQPPQPV